MKPTQSVTRLKIIPPCLSLPELGSALPQLVCHINPLFGCGSNPVQAYLPLHLSYPGMAFIEYLTYIRIARFILFDSETFYFILFKSIC